MLSTVGKTIALFVDSKISTPLTSDLSEPIIAPFVVSSETVDGCAVK